MLGRKVQDDQDEVRDQIDAAVGDADEAQDGSRPEAGPPDEPVMPAPPFPTFRSRPTLPHQVPGVGFESGRDSRAR